MDLQHIRLPWGCQPILDFNAPFNCDLYVTIIKEIYSLEEIRSIPSDIFKDHYLLKIDMTSVQHTI